MEILLKVTLPLITAIVLWFLKAAKERSTIGLAIFAEINAICEIAEERAYLKGLKEQAEELRGRGEGDDTAQSVQVKIPDHYCRVYLNNLDAIGKLDADEAELVVRFYQFIDSVVQDITEGGVLTEGVTNVESFDEAITIFEKALKAADQLREVRVGKAAQPWYKKLMRMVA